MIKKALATLATAIVLAGGGLVSPPAAQASSLPSPCTTTRTSNGGKVTCTRGTYYVAVACRWYIDPIPGPRYQIFTRVSSNKSAPNVAAVNCPFGSYDIERGAFWYPSYDLIRWF